MSFYFSQRRSYTLIENTCGLLPYSGMSSSTDTDLVLSCQRGNLEDFDHLYTRHLKGIFSFIFYRTMDRMTAEDLTSQTFLRALEHIGSYNPNKGAFSTWLYRIARNAVTDHYRTKREHVNIERVWDLPSDDHPFLETSQKQSREQIRNALAKLDADKREIVLLRLWDNLPYKEIAEITGKSEASCKMSFSRTIGDLRLDIPAYAFVLFCFFPPRL